jgi:DNA-binding XRE family transcriptional regulator
MIIKSIIMLFADRIRRLRDEKQMLRWQFATALKIDAAAYCKIEKSERKLTKR